jgi:hypothetical protein
MWGRLPQAVPFHHALPRYIHSTASLAAGAKLKLVSLRNRIAF